MGSRDVTVPVHIGRFPKRALAFFLGMERMLSDQALKQGRLGDALAHTGDEGRSTLR